MSGTIKTKTQKQNLSRENIFELAQSGQVAHAIVLWNKHMAQYEDCICEDALFDQKLCGFCLLGCLQSESLAASCLTHTGELFDAARTVSSFLMRRSRIDQSMAVE